MTTNALYIAKLDTYLIYDFQADGGYGPALRVAFQDLGSILPPILARARAEKRDVIVTDTGDCCVYHLEKGELVFPTPEDIAAAVAGGSEIDN